VAIPSITWLTYAEDFDGGWKTEGESANALDLASGKQSLYFSRTALGIFFIGRGVDSVDTIARR
jgi:hypothetical protein